MLTFSSAAAGVDDWYRVPRYPSTSATTTAAPSTAAAITRTPYRGLLPFNWGETLSAMADFLFHRKRYARPRVGKGY